LLGLRWYGHKEKTNNKRMPEQTVTARMVRIRKTRKPEKRWRMDAAEEDLKIMGMRNWNTVARDQREWRKTILKAKAHNGLWCLRWSRRRMIYQKPANGPQKPINTNYNFYSPFKPDTQYSYPTCIHYTLHIL
jgi:hypothetical protein